MAMRSQPQQAHASQSSHFSASAVGNDDSMYQIAAQPNKIERIAPTPRHRAITTTVSARTKQLRKSESIIRLSTELS